MNSHGLQLKTEGDALIFMPGKYEIMRTISAIRASHVSDRFVALPLYGELPPAEQDAALERIRKAQSDRGDQRGGNVPDNRWRAGGDRQRAGADRALRSPARHQHPLHREDQPRLGRPAGRPRGSHRPRTLPATLDGERTSRARRTRASGSETARSGRGRLNLESERN